MEAIKMNQRKIYQPIRPIVGWTILSVLLTSMLFVLFMPSQAVLGAPVASNPSYGGFLDE